MKILHAAETIRGGVASVMRHNIAAQTERFGPGNVCALVPADQAEDLEDAMPFRRFTFRRAGRGPLSLLRFLLAFTCAVIREKPDIVHLHSTFAGVLGRAALLLLWLFRRPRVVYCPHAWAFMMEGSAKKQRAYAMIERLLLPLAHRIICVSAFERAEAERFGLKGEKIALIHNGVPVPETVPAREAAETLRLLFVGRLDRQKGFDVLLEIVAALEGEPFHLTVVGDAVHAQVEIPERSNISYAGWVKASEVPGYFARADILVMPSRWEGFAMGPLEAMAHGLPILASDCCSIPEIVLEGKTGRLFAVGDSQAAAEALRDTSLPEWAAMGQNARLLIEERFTAARMTGETMALYEELLK